MKHSVEMTSDYMIQNMPSFITTGSGIQAVLKIITEQFGRLQVGITDGWDS
jgi:hypothetical protein